MEKLRRYKIKNREIECTSDKYPTKLINIKNYPIKLYSMGNEKILNHDKTIAIVGSRDCSEYGRKYAQIFAKELAKQNICIISGMALGIDTAAHYGAVYEIGKTIAVLAGGFNNIYPTENLWLYNLILKNGGCVITEHDKDEKTEMEDFPKRNRIISGISDAVLVIESRHRSGTRITAKYAKEQNKNIYCLPSNLGRVTGVGSNELIQEGATLVTSPNQILEDLYKKKNFSIQNNKENILQNSIEIPDEYKEIYRLINTNKEMSSTEIAETLQTDISKVNATLTMMELNEYIEQDIGNKFKIAKRRE